VLAAAIQGTRKKLQDSAYVFTKYIVRDIIIEVIYILLLDVALN
jgi:hypothetical protein